MKHDPLNIKMVAKQAIVYFILIEIVGVLISLFILFTDYIRQTFPELPIWILPIMFSVVFVTIGIMIWRRLSEADVLKYEFITVVTHKFRTPLTRIKWAAEDVVTVVPSEKKDRVDAILESERQLLALTDILVHLSAADVSRFDYHPLPMDVGAIFTDLSAQYEARAERKGVKLSFSSTPHMSIMADPEKSMFIFQILLDNALNYTPTGGSISVRSYPDSEGRHGKIEVSDTGIGMSKETSSRVFNRFYRGENARHADTEGMGIGLFMAKSIVEKQDGKLSVRSEGEGKGSTFSISMPLDRNRAR
ncbi:MAG: HAMP domain-containing sensor histidine kinase [Candidatus Pacebacteria bacterium]|nr:HAMP domain-containing sensor histidine kinase [Candidatus Paceibacterota bacterium]